MSRALLIANQYSNLPNYTLNGCFNDIDNIKKRLLRIDPKIEIVVMRDDLPTNSELFPTSNNIIQQFTLLCKSLKTKLYFYYSGHGTNISDSNRDEKLITNTQDGNKIFQNSSLNRDSCMVSNDIDYISVVSDDALNKVLTNLNSSQTLYAFMDSCHSGTAMDLCYVNMGQYTSNFKSKTLSNLQREILDKCNIISANYPESNNNINGNVILFAGTRDNAYSYEGKVNNVQSGYFTNIICTLLDIDASSYSIENFYYNLIALLNNKKQIPVLTTSKNINLKSYTMKDFKISPNKTLLKLLQKNISVIKSINFEKGEEIIDDGKIINYNGLLRLYLSKKTKQIKKLSKL